MKPEFDAHRGGPHARVALRDLSRRPGRGRVPEREVQWLTATLAGGQPHLPPADSRRRSTTCRRSEGTCESCHWPDRYIGDVIKVFYEYADDAANTETKTTVRLHVGGAVSGTGSGSRHSLAHEPVEHRRVSGRSTRRASRSPTSARPGPTARSREFFGEGVTAADHCRQAAAAHGLHRLPQSRRAQLRHDARARGGRGDRRRADRREDSVHPPRGRARAAGRATPARTSPTSRSTGRFATR